MIKKVSAFFVIMFLCSSITLAQVKSYRANTLETNSLSARGLGMGGAVTGVLNGTDAVIFNPSALVNVHSYTFFMKSDSSLADTSRYTVLSIVPGDVHSVYAFGMSGVEVDGIDIARNTGTRLEVEKSTSYYERMFFAAYAYKVSEKLSIGTVGKVFKYDLAYEAVDGTGSGADLDIGATYRWNEALTVALGYRNVASALMPDGTVQWDYDYRESFDYGPYLGLGQELFDNKLLLTADFWFSKAYPYSLGVGAEYSLHKNFNLRLGYNKVRGWSAGVGLRYAGFDVDYAYMPDFGTEIDNKHVITLAYSFDAIIDQHNMSLQNPQTVVVKDSVMYVQSATGNIQQIVSPSMPVMSVTMNRVMTSNENLVSENIPTVSISIPASVNSVVTTESVKF